MVLPPFATIYQVRLRAPAVCIAVAAAFAAPAKADSVAVRTQPQFEAAVRQLRASGGEIRLLPNLYRRRLVVAGRFGGPLRIVGSTGARVQRLLLYRTRGVIVGPLVLRPLTGDARIRVRASRDVVLRDLDVSARGTRFSAGVEVPDSDWVSIRHSTFTHCGDRSPNWSNCLLLRSLSSHVTVERSWFHDCYGCDFIHGRIGSHLTVRRTSLERTLPCDLRQIDARLRRYYLGRYASVRCEHQDPIELFGGDDLRFEHNHFGVYERGGGQLYITGETRRATIVGNVFVGSDRRVPGYRSRVGVLVGGSGGGPIPQYVRIVDNKIYTGARRADGYAASISISPGYQWRVPVAARPLIERNVIGLLETTARLCGGARMVGNVVLRGRDCAR